MISNDSGPGRRNGDAPQSQTVFRIRKSNREYGSICDSIANATDISWRAKGILMFLLSKPNGWNVYERHLVKLSTDGIKSTREGIKELLAGGYIVRRELRDDRGRYCGWEALVRDGAVKSVRKYFEACTGETAEQIINDVMQLQYGGKAINNRDRLRDHLKRALEEGNLIIPAGWDRRAGDRKEDIHNSGEVQDVSGQDNPQKGAHQPAA